MSYYDHATAMAFKLGRWREERTHRNYELEALACEQRASSVIPRKRSFLMRCLDGLRAHKRTHVIEPKSDED